MNNQEKGKDNIQEDLNDNELTLVFGGDVLLSDSMINTYNKDGGKITNILADDLLSEFKKAVANGTEKEFLSTLEENEYIREDLQYYSKLQNNILAYPFFSLPM